MKSHIPLVLFLCLLAPTTLAGEADAPTFGKAVYPDSIRFVTATSEDGEVMTMLFDNFVVSTRPGKGQHLGAETKSFSVANDLKAREGVTATLDVRGFVAVEEGGSAALLIHAGGETTIVDLSKAIEAAASKPRESEDALYAQAVENAGTAGLTVNARPKKSEDFLARASATFAPGEALQVTVLLLAERLSDADSSALITVDSIDISLKSAAPSRTKKEAEPKTAAAKTEKKTGSKTTSTKTVSSKTEKKNESAKTDKKGESAKTEGKVTEKAASKDDSKTTDNTKASSKKTSEKKSVGEKKSDDKDTGTKSADTEKSKT